MSFEAKLTAHADCVRSLADLAPQVEELRRIAIACLKGGGRLFFFGNGGSASQAQHFATELIGRFGRRNRPLPALALNADSAVLTALANDRGYEEVFALQVEALVRPEDLVIGLSTSGESENVVHGLRAAKRLGAQTAAFVGRGSNGSGGEAAAVAALAIVVPADVAATVQEGHLLIGHYLLEQIDQSLTP